MTTTTNRLALGLMAVLLILVASNVWWSWSYAKLDLDYMQEEGLRAEADSILHRLPDASVYQLQRTRDNAELAEELSVTCLNGADATIRPTAHFGTIVVSCGTMGIEQ